METITLLQGEQPSWISDYGYGDGSGKMCPCGHHEGYHNDKGVCLLSRNCRCKGLPAECRSTDEECSDWPKR